MATNRKRIDVHHHIVPPAYSQWLGTKGNHDAGGRAMPEWSVEGALRIMDEHDIATAIVSVSAPGVHLDPSKQQDPVARSKAREVNETAAKIASDHRGRFGFFATLTLPDLDGALEEVAYAFPEVRLIATGINSMRKTSLVASLLVLCLGPTWSTMATAGPYADDMGKCLVKQTGAADRTALMNWVFAAMALHPDVEKMSAISAELRADINKSAGALFQRLLVDSCRGETKLAIKYEGEPAIQSAFGLLGQIAMQELFADPNVAAGLGELEKNMDEKKIAELSAPE